jgi:hypothetical protein
MSDEAKRLVDDLAETVLIDGIACRSQKEALLTYIIRIERERDEARAENERLRELIPLARFGRWALDTHRDAYFDLDGDDLQDKAVEFGLLTEVEVAAPCSGDCVCAEYYGDDDFPVQCLRGTDAAKALNAIDAAKGEQT